MDINKFKDILLKRIDCDYCRSLIKEEHEKAIIQMQEDLIQEMGRGKTE